MSHELNHSTVTERLIELEVTSQEQTARIGQNQANLQSVYNRVNKLEADKQIFIDTHPVEPATVLAICKKRRRLVNDFLGGRENPAWCDKALKKALYNEAKQAFYATFNVTRYDLVPEVRREEALKFFDYWRPSKTMQQRIAVARRGE